MAEQLRHSDIVLSYAGTPDDMSGMRREACEKYGVTVWGWGPYYDGRLIAEAYRWGMRIVSSLVNLDIRESHTTEIGRDLFYNPKLSETTCKDIAGDPIVIPWWAREYGDDNRAYWHCTNTRWFREHLTRVVRNGILAGANAIHVDDAMSNAMVVRLPNTGGCFCDSCMAGFRTFLSRRYSLAELMKRGIPDLGAFDYRTLVRPVTPTCKAFGEAFARGEIPLQDEFKLFLTQEAAAFLGELVRCARETAGEEIPISANLGTMRPDNLLGAVHPDYFVIELHFWGPTGNLPLQPLKLAQALGKPCACWPIGANVDRVRRDGSTGMLKLWIATTYALGHNFMIPYRMWCSTSATGMVFWDAPDDEFLPIYAFIRESADLFDGFEERPQLGLLYSNRDARSSRSVAETTGWEMFSRNLSYELLLAGDDYLISRLDEAAAANYEQIVLPDAESVSCLDDDQRVVVSGWIASGKAAYWDDVRERLTPWVRITNAANVWALARQRTTAGATALVIHLVNHDYHAADNSFRDSQPVSLEVARSLFGAAFPRTASLRGPATAPVEVQVQANAEHVRVDVEMTGFWNLLVFKEQPR